MPQCIYLKGHTEKQTHETFKVCVSTIIEWVGQYKQQGHVNKKPLFTWTKQVLIHTYTEHTPEQSEA